MDLPLISGWAFYATAIPAVLLMGLSKSGFGAGLGALAVPLMALATPVPQAAALLMPAMLLIDIVSVAAFRRDLDKGLLRLLIPFGLLGTLVGTALFRVLDGRTVATLVGVFTLLFLAQRWLFPPRADSPPPPRWAGGLLATVAGFTSFVSHTGGPPLNAYVIPLRLPPVQFAATLAVFFFCINLAKWIPYAWLGLFDARNLATSVLLLPFAPLGVWAGVRIARRVSPVLFYRLINIGMLLTGLKLLWDGLR
ncbi:sulfite exporter TauE/SafE family protein [Pseudorhodoferax sp.]|uniref:sulfite exporter TauE/SafE family protein n=1 Tax=Pseudorhodoferax sp. TaxID=1993553 RepID=UPI002DD61DCF|nr:sulfite exporter TauE/SafE family protein [Pseudorhodoferax sp.]